jgi:protoporphyrinogen oxidase
MAQSEHLVVIGGGVCGLYGALQAARRGIKVTVLERNPELGGLAAGVQCGNNFYDQGVHMLHAHDKEIFEDVCEVMGDERIEVELNAKIRWQGSFYRYPLQFGDMVKGMNPFILAKCCIGLFATQIYYKLIPTEPKNAEEALIQLYGVPLYRFFFEEFTYRYWDLHPREMSAIFVKSKMPKLSAVDVIKKSLAIFGVKEKQGYSVESALSEETLHYSRRGAEALPRLLGEAVKAAGADVLVSAPVIKVKPTEGGGAEVTFERDGKPETIAATHVLSTMPIPELVEAFGDAATVDVRLAAKKLTYRAIVIFGLLVKKEKVIDALYIYYRDSIFHRVGEPKNAGLIVDPPDHTVLIVETTCMLGDKKWQAEEEVRNQIYADLEAVGLCKKEDVVECHPVRNPNGYPIFDDGFDSHLDKIKAYLATCPQIVTTGRNGCFCFPNMHKAMRMGANAVDELFGKKEATL